MSPAQFTLVRHGQTSYNAVHRLNGDPTIPVHLDEVGRAQCAQCAVAIRGRRFDIAVHTPFVRTQESLDILLEGRSIPRVSIPELGDVRLGVFEGTHVREYRAWRQGRPPSDRPDHGESRIDALARYVTGAERLLALEGLSVIAVLHDVPIRFIANAANGDDPIDGPILHIGNMQLADFDRDVLRVAIEVMRERLLVADVPASRLRIEAGSPPRDTTGESA